MSVHFTPDELEEIREFVNSIEHSAYIPSPAPERKRLAVTVILHDAVGDVAVTAHLTADDTPRIAFPAGVKGDRLEKLLTGDGA